MPTGLAAAFAGCEARSAEQPADDHPQRLSRARSVLDNVSLTGEGHEVARILVQRDVRPFKAFSTHSQLCRQPAHTFPLVQKQADLIGVHADR